MLTIIKRAAKAILPTPVQNRYLNIVGQLQLGQLPKKRFDAGNLRSLASLELSRIFSDPVICGMGGGSCHDRRSFWRRGLFGRR
jgi:hypothetical protein